MSKIRGLRQVLAENVRAAMKAMGLSQPKVAAAAKRAGGQIDATTVGRIARGDYPTNVDKLEALAKGLGISPWQLLIPEARDEKFIAILSAWVQADDNGRELLFIAARGALGFDGTERPRRAAGGGADRE